MKYRLLFTLAIIFCLHIFWIPTEQMVAAMERNVNLISFESLSEVSNQHDLTAQLTDAIDSEEEIGHIVPSECVTSIGMLVEGTPQTGAYLIRTFFAPVVLFVLAGMILMKKRAMR